MPGSWPSGTNHGSATVTCSLAASASRRWLAVTSSSWACCNSIAAASGVAGAAGAGTVRWASGSGARFRSMPASSRALRPIAVSCQDFQRLPSTSTPLVISYPRARSTMSAWTWMLLSGLPSTYGLLLLAGLASMYSCLPMSHMDHDWLPALGPSSMPSLSAVSLNDARSFCDVREMVSASWVDRALAYRLPLAFSGPAAGLTSL